MAFNMTQYCVKTGEIMIFDLSHPIKNAIPIYPGDPETALFSVKNFESDGYRLTKLETGLHAGTHIDMPSCIQIVIFILKQALNNSC